MDLILHHYDLSPFSEKVRLALGYKGLAWKSAQIPIWPPRPDFAPLTAGYRRVPVLQIGADIYCDTALILRELDRRTPEPTLYPDDQKGQATIVGWWAESTMFMTIATLTTSIIGDGLPKEFLDDRIAFMKHDFSKAASLRDAPLNRQRVTAAMGLLADMLKDGRPYLLGRNLSAADLSAYHVLWFARKNGGAEIEAMLPYAPLEAWMSRVAAIGHGTASDISAEDALAVARNAEPAPVRGVSAADPSGLKAGAAVTVRAEQESDPIRGLLVGADEQELVIASRHERVGIVHVHLPRFGYSVLAS